MFALVGIELGEVTFSNISANASKRNKLSNQHSISNLSSNFMHIRNKGFYLLQFHKVNWLLSLLMFRSQSQKPSNSSKEKKDKKKKKLKKNQNKSINGHQGGVTQNNLQKGKISNNFWICLKAKMLPSKRTEMCTSMQRLISNLVNFSEQEMKHPSHR